MKILITGGSGLVGQAFVKHLPEAVYLNSKMADLRNDEQTYEIFRQIKPDAVIHLAARVGGVKVNSERVAEFYHDNVRINTSVLEASRLFGVKKVVSLLSTCIYPDAYPDNVSYPLTEDKIHCGEPHPSNFGYAYAKRMLDVQSRAYRQQYGCNYITAVPNNIFGPHDNFDLNDAHVIPALIRKTWEAKINKTPLEIWGDGNVYREFTYSEDVAKILLFLLEHYNESSPVNVGNPQEYHLRAIINKICNILDYNGEIIWNTSKPKGQIRKPSSNQKLIKAGWNPEDYTDIDAALRITCDWFKKGYPNLRGILSQ